MNKKVLIAAMAACFTSPSIAGNLQLSPIGMTLAPGQKVEKLRVINHNKTPALIQFQGFKWTQVGGKDVEVETTDIRYSPAIVEIPAGGEQIVRVIRMSPGNPGKEDTYRTHLSELPPKAGTAPVQGAGATVLITYNMALFFRPKEAQPKLEFRWEGTKLAVSNSGAATAQLANAGAEGAKAWVPGLVGYVLPGSTMKFEMPGKASTIKVTVNGVSTSARVE